MNSLGLEYVPLPVCSWLSGDEGAMDRTPEGSPSQTRPELLRLDRVLAISLLIAVCVVGLLLSLRSLIGEDLGCHIAYGQEFWQHGRIVDCNQGILYPGFPG